MMLHAATAALIVPCLLALSAEAASGEFALDTPEPEPPPSTYWYGWQTLTSDGLAASLFVAGLATEGGNAAPYDSGLDSSDQLYVASFLTYALGTPIVHLAHGNFVTSPASFGLRLVGAFAGGAVGAAFESDCSAEPAGDQEPPGCGTPVALLTGIAMGALTVSALDAFVFAEDIEEPPPVRRGYTVRMRPFVALTPGPVSRAANVRALDLAFGLRGEF